MRSLVLTILLGISVFYCNRSCSQELNLAKNFASTLPSPPTKEEVMYGILHADNESASYEFQLEQKRRVPGTGVFTAGVVVVAIGAAMMIVSSESAKSKGGVSITSTEGITYLLGMVVMVPGAALMLGGGTVALIHLSKREKANR